jgi:hypothetical protein
LLGLLKARDRVRLIPKEELDALEGALTIEYDPARGLTISHSDEKLVFVLGSNPDEVLGNIAQFAENEKTAATILKLSDVLVQDKRNEVAEKSAISEINQASDTLLSNQMEIVFDQFGNGLSRDEAIEHVRTLIDLLRAQQG